MLSHPLINKNSGHIHADETTAPLCLVVMDLVNTSHDKYGWVHQCIIITGIHMAYEYACHGSIWHGDLDSCQCTCMCTYIYMHDATRHALNCLVYTYAGQPRLVRSLLYSDDFLPMA